MSCKKKTQKKTKTSPAAIIKSIKNDFNFLKHGWVISFLGVVEYPFLDPNTIAKLSYSNTRPSWPPHSFSLDLPSPRTWHTFSAGRLWIDFILSSLFFSSDFFLSFSFRSNRRESNIQSRLYSFCMGNIITIFHYYQNVYFAYICFIHSIVKN